jgi:hypothetical protein
MRPIPLPYRGFPVYKTSAVKVMATIASSLSEFSTQCDLVLPVSISTILSFPQGHPVAAYVFFLVFPSLLSFLLSFLQ